MRPLRPLISPLGDRALTIAFSDSLNADANRRAVAVARTLQATGIAGVVEVVPNLVSVFVGFDPRCISFHRLSGEIALTLAQHSNDADEQGTEYAIETSYGGGEGPHLAEVADRLSLTAAEFTTRHAAARLKVLAIGFAPGFAYCGMHEKALVLPRRSTIVRAPAGSILFAAGQTALCATPVPTGWWIIGRTHYRSFDPDRTPPVALAAGDRIRFPAGAR